ncbi:protein translocase subunit SecD [Streptacidiphilus cavernicola]|uniref:Protein translocase subunit SecD n=1 Tax=Streptacidiphilus cavernicola TaxID=3342716 RepID=A0ABV6VQI9_9ACTN
MAVVALVGIMFATGNTTPHLGIDLKGGTSITAQAAPPPGKPASAVNSTSLNETVAILNKRFNAFGVSEAQVQTEGSKNIVVTLPAGTDPTTAEEQITKSAVMYFRPVIATAFSGTAPAAAPTPTASGSATATPSATATGSTVATAPSSAATPTAAKTQGDAVTGDLKAASTASATAAGTPSAAATVAPSTPAAPPAAGTATIAGSQQGSPPSDIATQFNNLDCSKAAQRKDYQLSETGNTVACSSDGSAGWIKYALGPVAVPGTDISNASAGLSQQTGQWQVDLGFNGSGNAKFGKVTTQLSGNSAKPPTNQFAIVLDGAVVSAPSVNTPILGGQAQITGNFDQKSANDLATVLNAGAIPLTLTLPDVTTVSPELGGSQLTAGMVSGAIGLALVVLYSLLYYRGLGLVAIAGLMVSAALTYSLMCLLGAGIQFTLNLPAVCGAIVAIGITADSFVVYFERIRDELRHGTSLRPAVQRAWPKARRTILVADFVSFLAAAVLYFFTVGKVQGFAFTLGLTTLLDVVVIFLFTKPLITLLARRRFFADGHPMSGLDPKRLGVRPPLRGGRRPLPAAPKEA